MLKNSGICIRRIFAVTLVVAFCFMHGREGLSDSSPGNVPKDIVPADFDGVDPCLRDTSGSMNECARRHGVHNDETGLSERPCRIYADAVKGLQKALAYMKEKDPDIEIMIISSYRPPEHQQCLWVKDLGHGKYKCNPLVCGPRDPKTKKKLPCKFYDLSDPKYKDIYNNCPHVNYRTVDLCAYTKRNVPINERNQIDLTQAQDCRKYGQKQPEGWYFHPCTCRFASWTDDFRSASKKARNVFGDEETEAQKIMIESMRKAGWRDNAPGEWWHFQYRGK